MALEINKIAVLKIPDDTGDLSWLTDESRYDGLAPELAEMGKALDAARVATYGEDWWFVGVLARAEIEVSGVTQTISSAGLWGVESDSSPTYFRELGDTELAALALILTEMGVEDSAIDADAAEWFPGG